MKNFRTIVSLIAMVLYGMLGFLIGTVLGNAFGGAILFTMTAGIACVVYTIDNRKSEKISVADLTDAFDCDRVG